MYTPLAERLRPKELAEIAGQDHIVGKNGLIAKIVQNKTPFSLLLFGPPGSGKTTIARLYAKSFNLPWTSLSAVLNSAAELKKILKDAQETPLFSRQILLFVDEIHRFNRSQQDIFLPFLEDGSLILVGATTENPSFALNSALLSRLRILSLNALGEEALEKIVLRYEQTTAPLPLEKEARQYLLSLAGGDGRHLLNLIENLEGVAETLDVEALSKLLRRRSPIYDKNREGHYNLISALHKAIRGSDPDASLYWFARILNGGEDPLFLARRLIRIASEDVGLADPNALRIAIDGWQCYERLGSPEGELALAQVVVYLALAPKSNALYTAFKAVREAAEKTGHLNPPKKILNAPTSLMTQMGYGEGYLYDPDTPHGFSGQNYFPDEMERTVFYQPVERGFEREMKKRIDYFNKLRLNLATNLEKPV